MCNCVTVCAQVLAAEINLGYEDIVNTAVFKFNGQRVVRARPRHVCGLPCCAACVC